MVYNDCPVGFYCPAGTNTLKSMKACGTTSAPQTTAAVGKSLVGDCVAATPTTAITGCTTYTTTAGTSCVRFADGYVQPTMTAGIITPLTTSTPCASTNCKTCTDGTAGTCTVAKDGYYVEGTGASQALKACPDGCFSCSLSGTTVTCGKAKAGWSISASGVLAACAAGQGTASADNHSDTACVACDATKFCKNCKQTTVCTTCLPGYTIDTATGVCNKFSGTAHGTC